MHSVSKLSDDQSSIQSIQRKAYYFWRLWEKMKYVGTVQLIKSKQAGF